MAEMKPSGIDGFFNIPTDWEVNKMVYVFSFGRGLSITKEELQDEGIPAISYGDIHSRYGFEVDPAVNELRHVDPKYLKTSRGSLLQYGDFIFADTSEDIAGSGNFTYLNSHETTFASYHTITARANRPIDYRYMAYLFDSEPFRTQIRNSVSGVKVYSITQLILKNAKLLLPPLPEQSTIAAFLDDRCGQVDGIIADLEQQVEILRQYKKALITEIVTKGLDKSAPMKDSGIDWIGEIPAHWKLKRIKHGAGVIGSGTTPESGNMDYYDGDIPWIQSGDLYGRDVITETEKTITSLAVKSYSALRQYCNDFVIVAMYGASVGNVAISKISAFVNQACCVLIPDSNNDVQYLYYWLTVCQDDLVCQSFGGGQPNISQQKIKNEPFVQAPLSEQQAIADFLGRKGAEVDALITVKQRAADVMRQYKKSLIYEYVTGKRRVVS